MKDIRTKRDTDAQPNSRRTLIRIPLDSNERLDRLLALEERLEKSGLEIETGTWVDKGVREWDLEVGRGESKRILGILKGEGFRPEIAPEERPRKKRGRYRAGDVFRIPLANGRFAYGRILAVEPPRPVFVEIYSSMSQEDPPMADLARADWLLKVYCADDGIANGSWKIIGHLPIAGPLTKPLFWDDSPFDGKFYLREDPVRAVGQRETTIDEITRLRAQRAVLASSQSVEIALDEILVRGLKHEWVNPEESRNPVRNRANFHP